MAGIAGALGTIDERTEQAVRRMDAHLARGGRDPGGVHAAAVISGPRLLLAWRHGASDTSTDAAPAVDGAITVARAGRIVNADELRVELGDRGGAPRDRQTGLLLQAYQAWGRHALARIEGPCATVIWDATRGELVLGRDRMGVRSVYLCRSDHAGGTILFATQVRALLASGLVPRRVDPTALGSYLWNGFVTGPATLVASIRGVPPGGSVTVAAGSLEAVERRHWRVPPNVVRPDAERALGAALRTAVRRRLDCTGEVGLFLSGGIDSSAVAALARSVTDAPLRTFSIAFDEAEFDESPHALAVAERLGTRHQRILVTQAGFRDQVDAALLSLDQPSFDALNTALVSRAVREAGVDVALGGTGGDDLFGGNATFVDIPRARRWGRRLSPLPRRLLRAIAPIVVRARLGPAGEVPPQTRWGKLADVLAARGRLLELYQLSYALFTPAFLEQLRAGAFAAAPFGIARERFDDLERLVAGRSTMYGIASLELELFVADRLLRDIESVGTEAGLEIGSPLIDESVIEAWSGVHESRLFVPIGRKQLLRDIALADLDPALFDRPKKGFVLPLERWCLQELKDRIDDTLGDDGLCRSAGLDAAPVQALWRAFQAGAPGLYWSRIWSLFVYLRWCREHEMTID